MASSTSTSNSAATTAANNQHYHGSMPAPPPPTPSNQALAMSLPSDVDAALSRALQLLTTTPKLSSPFSRRSRLSASVSEPPPTPPSEPLEPPKLQANPPIISLHQDQETQKALLLTAASEFGFFHLTDHGIPSHLPAAALVEARSLLVPGNHNITSVLKGINHEDGEDGDGCQDPSVALDASAGDLADLPALGEYAGALERVAVELVELLLRGGGFSSDSFQKEATRCLMRISSSSGPDNLTEEGEEAAGEDENEEIRRSCYPYVVCLQYEMKGVEEPWFVVGDSGESVSLAHRADSVLVTLGDITQVWSNGRFKKVRGMPQHTLADGRGDSGTIYMSVLLF